MKTNGIAKLAVALIFCVGFAACDDDEGKNPKDPAGGLGSSGDGSVGLVGAVAEAIDLGLPSGTLWASWNVGAAKPEDCGVYYAWGELSAKEAYGWDNYKWSGGSYDNLTKYCADSDLGTVDNKTELDQDDDVARQMWGDGWIIPSKAQCQELVDECEWTWVSSYNGTISGWVVAGSNGNDIFLPAAGYRYGNVPFLKGASGYYWARQLYDRDCDNAYELIFYEDAQGIDSSIRCYGRSVRPVKHK